MYVCIYIYVYISTSIFCEFKDSHINSPMSRVRTGVPLHSHMSSPMSLPAKTLHA